MLHDRVLLADQRSELLWPCVAVFSCAVILTGDVRGLGATATVPVKDSGVRVARTAVAVRARPRIVGSVVGHRRRVGSDAIAGELGSSADPGGRGFGDPA